MDTKTLEKFKKTKAEKEELEKYRAPPVGRPRDPKEEAQFAFTHARAEMRKAILQPLIDRRLALAREYLAQARALRETFFALCSHEQAIVNLTGQLHTTELNGPFFAHRFALPALPPALRPTGTDSLVIEANAVPYIHPPEPTLHEKAVTSRAYHIQAALRANPALQGEWPFNE